MVYFVPLFFGDMFVFGNILYCQLVCCFFCMSTQLSCTSVQCGCQHNYLVQVYNVDVVTAILYKCTKWNLTQLSCTSWY